MPQGSHASCPSQDRKGLQGIQVSGELVARAGVGVGGGQDKEDPLGGKTSSLSPQRGMVLLLFQGKSKPSPNFY